jgi:hypothetical protein
VTVSNNTKILSSETVSVNFIAMLEVVSGTFVSTVVSAHNLNEDLLTRSWQSVVVIGTLAGFVVCFMALGHYLDREQIKVTEALKKADRTALLKYTKQEVSGRSFFGSSFPGISPAETKPKIRKVLYGTDDSRAFMKIVEDALPQVLSSKSLFKKFTAEVKRHHRWVGVVCHFTRQFPRSLRVLALSSNIITMLFIQSLTYNLMQGDDGSCALLVSEEACLEPSSAFSGGSSMCYWNPVEDDDIVSSTSRCLYVEPDNSLNVIFFVAIFSAILSTPIAFSVDWMIHNVLSAPSRPFGKRIKTAAIVPSPETTEVITPVVPSPVRRSRTKPFLAARNQIADADNILALATRKQYEALQQELKAYRERLEDKQEFDGKILCNFDTLTDLIPSIFF